MKIALLYSGLPILNIDEYFENHYNYILSHYSDIDIYYSTYSESIDNDNAIQQFDKLFKPKVLDIQKFSDIKYDLEQINNSITRKEPETQSINTLSMFYKIYRVFNLINFNNTYDIVIRNRVDTKFDSELTLIQNDCLNVPCGGDHKDGLMDLFAYGSREIMKIYSDLYNQINSHISDNIVFHPETILRYHCNKNNLCIHRFQYNIYLRGLNFTTTAPCR